MDLQDNLIWLEAGSLRIAQRDARDIRNGKPPEQMFFEAIMARVETNGNKDELTETHLQEVAASLSHTPIDEEHKQGIVQGTILSARYDPNIAHPRQQGKKGALLASCVTWPRRFPKQAADLLAGTLKFSIESSAESVMCSACGSEFLTSVQEEEYCDCLKARRQPGSKTSRRWLKNRGIGAAFTYNPAGTDCAHVPGSVMLVASYEESDSPEEVSGMLTASIFMANAQKPYGDVHYADPGYQKDKKERYPLDSEKHVRAAWSYINQEKNGAEYTSSQLSHIKGEIRSAAKKYSIQLEAHMDKETLKRKLALIAAAAKDGKDDSADDGDEDDMTAVLRDGVKDVAKHFSARTEQAVNAAKETVTKEHQDALTAAVKEAKDQGALDLLAEKRCNALERIGVENVDRVMVASMNDAQWTFTFAGYTKQNQATPAATETGAALLAGSATTQTGTPGGAATQGGSGATTGAPRSMKDFTLKAHKA